MSGVWRLEPLGHLDGPFTKPASVEVANENEIFVVDDADTTATAEWSGQRRLWRVNESGASEIQFGQEAFPFDDIALGQPDNIYAYHSGPGENCLRIGVSGEVKQAYDLGQGLSRVSIDRLGRIWAAYVDPEDGRWLKLFEANGRLMWSNDDRRSPEYREMFAAVASVFDLAQDDDGSLYLALGCLPDAENGPVAAHLGRDRRPIAPAVQRSSVDGVEFDCITVSDGVALATPGVAGKPWMVWLGKSGEVDAVNLEVDGLTNPYVSGLSASGPVICACVPQLKKLLLLRIEHEY
jgi:hypothetical protein